MSIKSNIISKFGGVGVVAKICGITSGAVSQWGEFIPAKHQAKLLAAAASLNIDITSNDLIILPKIKQKSAPNSG